MFILGGRPPPLRLSVDGSADPSIVSHVSYTGGPPTVTPDVFATPCSELPGELPPASPFNPALTPTHKSSRAIVGGLAAPAAVSGGALRHPHMSPQELDVLATAGEGDQETHHVSEH